MHVLKRGVDLYVWRNIHLIKGRLFLFLMLFILSVMLFVMNQFPYATVGVILIPLAYILIPTGNTFYGSVACSVRIW